MSLQKNSSLSDQDQFSLIFRDLAERLTENLPKNLTTPNLFDNVFESHLITEMQDKNASRFSASYLLIMQITFYRILSENRDDLPKINPHLLTEPHELSEFFKKILKKVYNPIFRLDIVTKLDKDSFGVLMEIINIIYELKPEKIPYEILATVFNSIIPVSIRKIMGVYYSRFKTAKLLSYLAIESPDTKVLDPACGCGTLLVSSYRRKKELLLQEREKFSIEDHRRFLSSEITGIDIMPFAVHFSSIYLALQAPQWETHQIRLAIIDSTLFNPKSKNQLILGTTKNEEIIKSSKQLYLDFVDLVIMNPPFVRQESLKNIRKSYKDELLRAFDNYRSLIDKRMSYYCYFLFLADKFLKKGGKIAAVIPASFLRVNSTYQIRKWLLEHYNIQYIICQKDKPNFSEKTAFREVLLIAQKNHPTTEIVYIIVEDFDQEEFPAKELNVGKFPNSWDIRIVPKENLSSKNLFLPIATMKKFNLLKKWNLISKQDSMITFEGYIRKMKSDLKRGIETSKGFKIQNMVINENNSNYLRLADIWIFNNETQTHINIFDRNSENLIRIPKKCLIPHLRRMSGENRLDISNKKEFVVTSSFSRYKDFLATGKMSNKKISSARLKNWRTYVEERMTHLMIARRFDISSSGTFLFSFFSKEKRAPPGVMWAIPNLSREDAKILSLYFNSTFNILQIFLHRVETRGAWMQLHEYVIKDLKLPNITLWTEEERFPFYQLFEEIKNYEFPPLWQQLAMNIPVSEITHQDHDLLKNQYSNFDIIVGSKFVPRKKLDYLILNRLRFMPKKKYETFLQKIYLSFLLEIVTLKKMMN
ncbi:MAG: Eco57I restriction-modification methylase domain-containing protein [Candidatus Hodarchaeales archaeon]